MWFIYIDNNTLDLWKDSKYEIDPKILRKQEYTHFTLYLTQQYTVVFSRDKNNI